MRTMQGLRKRGLRPLPDAALRSSNCWCDRHYRRVDWNASPGGASARESARRASCASNMRQIGLGILGYESPTKFCLRAAKELVTRARRPRPPLSTHGPEAHGNFPTSRDFPRFAMILPFVDRGQLFQTMDVSKSYRDRIRISWPERAGCHLCLSNGSLGANAVQKCHIHPNGKYERELRHCRNP